MSTDLSRYRITPGAEATVEDIDLDAEEVIVNGKRYSEADAEADAADAARVIRAERTRGLSRGGTSLSGDGSHSPTVATVIPRDVRDEVQARAAAEGMSVSKWLRRLIEREVGHRPAA